MAIIMKKVLSLLVSTILVLSSIIIFPSGSAYAKDVKIKERTVRLYTKRVFRQDNLSIGKNEDPDIEFSVTNKKYIKCDLYNWCSGYELTVSGEKLTRSVKPVVTVYRRDSAGKKIVINKLCFTVKPVLKVKFNNIAVNKGATKKLPDFSNMIRVGYEEKYSRDLIYTLSNKNVVAVENDIVRSNNLYYMYYSTETSYGTCVTGLNYGRTKVTVWLKGTNQTLGSFYAIVANIKPSVKKRYRTVTMYYNERGRVYGDTAFLLTILKNTRKGAEYTAVIRDKNVAYAGETPYGRYFYDEPDEPCIKAKKPGRTRVDVYENLNGKTTKIDSFILRVKRKKMAALVNWLKLNEEMCPEESLLPGQTFNVKNRLVNWYLLSFKKSEYSITFKSLDPEALSVNKKGIVKCNKKFDYTTVCGIIKFSDGSTTKCDVFFDLEE